MCLTLVVDLQGAGCWSWVHCTSLPDAKGTQDWRMGWQRWSGECNVLQWIKHWMVKRVYSP